LEHLTDNYSSHRLSTVTSADQILVLHAGKVAEAGTHEELLAMKGRYANMWRKQIRAERAAEAASQMVAKANALQKAVMNRPGSSGNEGGTSEDVSENEAETRSGTTLVPSLSSRAFLHPEAERDGDSYMQGSQTSDTIDFDGADDRGDAQSQQTSDTTSQDGNHKSSQPGDKNDDDPSEGNPVVRADQ
jgi:hypothetical protein